MPFIPRYFTYSSMTFSPLFSICSFYSGNWYELCVITTAEPILLIMGATAVIGAIVAGTAPVLKLIEMQEPNLSPSSGLESSNTEHTYLNRQRVI
ncbi:hypothetical protein [Wolbachia endosymbiont of Frankliniella intonsa]|uniref:hypothetical protein n=1 Tax=Wolbachia endosymbiont of Frankliniella intonsa TaxID=2902422 RepID=UPI00244EA5C3|nr:hypothetical protein [Wolbachia endosymbiont of Frankliniella intonsa]WGJ62082.1 hypothetical protein M3L71_07720 [Wolbachia endosymbiont of Frankliniella intonsa]